RIWKTCRPICAPCCSTTARPTVRRVRPLPTCLPPTRQWRPVSLPWSPMPVGANRGLFKLSPMSQTTTPFAAGATPERLVIATRESRLALWQAEHVRDRLLALYPDCRVELLGMTTKGDRILDRTLSKVGGKGLFVKELEAALLDGRADLAVHSLKDVPVDLVCCVLLDNTF